MHNIELYVGNTDEKPATEESVLSRVIDWLDEHQLSAVIYHDILLDKRQVDLLIGTETTTLQIEVKGDRLPISGRRNGEWMAMTPDGRVSRRDNAFIQALRNNQHLRSAMQRFLPGDAHVAYPNGAVVFEPRLPPGSDIRIVDDWRVRLCDGDDLAKLLSTPSPNPWPLSWMRDFAKSERYIWQPLPPGRAATEAARAQSRQAAPRAHSAATRGDIASDIANRPHATTDVTPSTVVEKTPPHAALPEPTAIVPVHTMPNDRDGRSMPYAPPPMHRKPRRRLLRYALILFVLANATLWFVRRPHPTQDARAESASAPPASASIPAKRGDDRHRTATARVRRKHAKPEAAEVRTKNVRSALPAQPAAAPVATAITCPAGVDRLGCNGRTGLQPAPECPPGFHVASNTCVRDAVD